MVTHREPQWFKFDSKNGRPTKMSRKNSTKPNEGEAKVIIIKPPLLNTEVAIYKLVN